MQNFILNANIRKESGKETRVKSKIGKIPAVVYGNEVKNVSIEVDAEAFRKLFEKTGESSLVNLKIEGEGEERPVLIHDIQRNPVSDKIIHIDFYQISLKQEVEVAIPLIFEGVSLAIKDLGGTLVREMQEIKVKALPQNLPHDIKVDISPLKTFDDEIKIKDLILPPNIKISKGPDEIVALVVPPSKVEEELEKPIEEKVEDVQKVEKKQKDAEVGSEVEEKPAGPKGNPPSDKK